MLLTFDVVLLTVYNGKVDAVAEITTNVQEFDTQNTAII